MPFSLPARILMADASSLLERGTIALRAGELTFDLAAVTECDSSLLACLNQWRREAARLNLGAVRVINPPDSIKRIARLYAVENLTLGVP